MRLGLKMALSTLCAVALLFGICGGILIALSFQNSLDREKASVRESYETLLETLAAVGSLGAITTQEDITSMLERMYAGSASPWAALRLTSDGAVLYEMGHIDDYLQAVPDMHADMDARGASLCLLVPEDAPPALLLSGSCTIDTSTVYLDSLHDISGLYANREGQLSAFRMAFVVLVAACAVLTFATAFILTRPLSKLSRAASGIAAGELRSRSNVHTDDEVGSLARDFDLMAVQIERNIEGMRESLERQQRFMGNFAHEMKTPMTSVVGYADLLRRDTLDGDERVLAAQYVFDEGRRLEALSQKLLQLFVLDGTREPPERCDMRALVQGVAGPLSAQWKAQGIELAWRAEETYCLVDADLVRSLLVNLLENARRALADEKDKRVIVTCVGAAEGGCEITVTDTGCGIPQEDLARITEEFYRVDKARSRAAGGAGLGLALCSKIMEAHGGRLSIESAPGKGTSVRAWFPGKRPRHAGSCRW